jgi:hypothetical protein
MMLRSRFATLAAVERLRSDRHSVYVSRKDRRRARVIPKSDRRRIRIRDDLDYDRAAGILVTYGTRLLPSRTGVKPVGVVSGDDLAEYRATEITK